MDNQEGKRVDRNTGFKTKSIYDAYGRRVGLKITVTDMFYSKSCKWDAGNLSTTVCRQPTKACADISCTIEIILIIANSFNYLWSTNTKLKKGDTNVL